MLNTMNTGEERQHTRIGEHVAFPAVVDSPVN